jgi:hypothetical protein
MRRLLRWTFHALAAASLLLCLATAGLWVRSHWVYDRLFARRLEATESEYVREYRREHSRYIVSSFRGHLAGSLEWYEHTEVGPTPPWEFHLTSPTPPRPRTAATSTMIWMLTRNPITGSRPTARPMPATPSTYGPGTCAIGRSSSPPPPSPPFSSSAKSAPSAAAAGAPASASAPPAGTTSARRRRGARNAGGREDDKVTR